MEKVQFKPAKAKDKAAFLAGQRRSKTAPRDEKPEKEPPQPKEGAPIDGGEFYQLIEPIQTALGPIPRFIATPDAMPTHPSIGLFGKRRTGKSYTARDWCYNCFRDIPFGVVLTDTKQNGFWQQYFPDKLVHQGLKMHILQSVIKRQKTLVDKFGKDDPRIRCIVILGKLKSQL